MNIVKVFVFFYEFGGGVFVRGGLGLLGYGVGEIVLIGLGSLVGGVSIIIFLYNFRKVI